MPLAFQSSQVYLRPPKTLREITDLHGDEDRNAVLREAYQLPTRLGAYRLSTWKPQAELASLPRRLRPRWNKAFLIDSGLFLPMVLCAGALLTLVVNNPCLWKLKRRCH